MTTTDSDAERSLYWKVEGQRHPYWVSYLQENYPKQGVTTRFWHNRDAETDMGDMYGPEFHEMFPHARIVTEEEYTSGAEHICSDGYSDWGFSAHCPNCACGEQPGRNDDE